MRGSLTKFVPATVLVALTMLALPVTPALAEHVQCGDTITADTTLDSDLVDCPRDGIVFGADGITLDLGGHVVDGSSFGSGIYAGGRRRVTVENGAVTHFNIGVLLEFSDNTTVRAVVATENSYGIMLVYTGSARVQGNTSSFNRFEGIRIYGDSEADNLLGENAIEENGDIGILVTGTRRNRIENNVVSQTRDCCGRSGGGMGVLIAGSDENRLNRNVITDSATYGIFIGYPLYARRSEDNILLRNRVSKSSLDGIFLEGPHYGAFEVGGAFGTVVERNLADSNGDDGIDAGNPDTTLTRNRARTNKHLGIEAVPGVIDGGGNRAFGNGHPLQCRNVYCK